MIVYATYLKDLMELKDNIGFSIYARAEHEMRAAALKGESGCLFEYPAELKNTEQINHFYDLLLDSGYTVTVEDSDDESVIRIGIYWAA